MNTYQRLTNLFEGYHDVVTIREAALVVRCSKEFILNLVGEMQIAHFTVGTHFRVFKEDIILYFAGTSCESSIQEKSREAG